MMSDQRRRVEEIVRALAKSPRHGETSPEGHARAVGLIEDWLQDAGCAVSRQTFEMPIEAGGRSGVNVIARLKGDSGGESASVIIGAHFDTRPNSPGADDNASGVAAMVECARALTGRGLRRDVVLVAFDAEERQGQLHGLWGSEAFVRSLAGAASGNTHRRSAQDRPSIQVRAAFVLEMVGFSSQKGTQKIPLPMRALFPAAGWSVMRRGYAGDFLVAVTRGRGKIVARALARHSSRVGGPEVLTLGLPAWLPPPPDLLRSDHAPFWQAGVPAVMIGDTANFRNPNYHLPSDTPETLDYEMIAGVARALAETVSELSTER